MKGQIKRPETFGGGGSIFAFLIQESPTQGLKKTHVCVAEFWRSKVEAACHFGVNDHLTSYSISCKVRHRWRDINVSHLWYYPGRRWIRGKQWLEVWKEIIHGVVSVRTVLCVNSPWANTAVLEQAKGCRGQEDPCYAGISQSCLEISSHLIRSLYSFRLSIVAK